MSDMNELMLDFLQDIYYAEKVGLRSMAKIGRTVQNEELKEALQHHREQTQKQVERLGEVFRALGKKPRTKTCAAMDGLIEEGNEAIQEMEKGPVLDSALLACQQAAEHYEIARYGALAAWARAAGMEEAAEILTEILGEEKEADEHLNDIAERILNPQVAQQPADEGEADEEEEVAEPEPEPVQEAPKRGRRAPARARK